MNPMYLSGFGISLNVGRARLIAKDGFLEPDVERVTHELQPRDPRYDSIVIDGDSGTVSLGAVKWAMRHGMSIFVLDCDGPILSSILSREAIASSALKLAHARATD